MILQRTPIGQLRPAEIHSLELALQFKAPRGRQGVLSKAVAVAVPVDFHVAWKNARMKAVEHRQVGGSLRLGEIDEHDVRHGADHIQRVVETTDRDVM